MKVLDFDLEGSHFIIEADISLRQEVGDNMRMGSMPMKIWRMNFRFENKA